jgi:hypothetical protein
MSGVVVTGMDALTYAPSTHFGRTLLTDGSTPALRALTADLIDGRTVLPRAPFAIYSIGVSAPSSDWVRIAVVNVESRRRLTCFVVDVFARQENDGIVGWDAWDPRGVPRLFEDVLDASGQWELYNCEVVVWPWRRTELYASIYPPEY